MPSGGLNTQHPHGNLVGHILHIVWMMLRDLSRRRSKIGVPFSKAVGIHIWDEGNVLKDVGSKWEPSNRNGKWLKLKPEYIRASSDLDVLIVGGCYGFGRRGGEEA